jgi:DNA-binding transcriptional MerR regulator
MAEPTAAHLSIGEVLGLLLTEFPDVTISKIRFLESQGLIEPERTPSGYRKFYDADVELLRLILREQREHFLPLRVIKDRIDSGEIEPSIDVVANHPAARSAGTPAGSASAVPPRRTPPASSHPVHTSTPPVGRDEVELSPTPAAIPRPSAAGTPARTNPSPRLLPGVLVNRDELCAMAHLTPAQLAQLEEYGVVARRRGAGDLYGEDAVEIAAAAGGFLRAGVDARHLRAWRTSVEREVGLYEQLVMPLLRQRRPEARAEASTQLDELDVLGAKLRAALTRAAIRQVVEH